MQKYSLPFTWMCLHIFSFACSETLAHFVTCNGALPGALTTIPHNVEKDLAFSPMGCPSVLNCTTSLSPGRLLNNLIPRVLPRVLFFPMLEPVFNV